MKKIKELTTEELKEILLQEDIDKIKEPCFKIVNRGRPKKEYTPPLVQIEIAFRKCVASGVFSN